MLFPSQSRGYRHVSSATKCRVIEQYTLSYHKACLLETETDKGISGNLLSTSYSGHERHGGRDESVWRIRRVRRQESEEVQFEKKIPSLSVVHGSQARMKCSVKSLGDHEVS